MASPVPPAQHWLVKSEPEAYAWATLVREGRTAWTGVRNFQARANLRAMRRGDLVAFYHSVTDKQVVGVARVEREAYPDPTAEEGEWSCVDLAPVEALAAPVSLEAIKGDPVLAGMALVRQSRLSVTPLSAAEYARLLDLGRAPAGARASAAKKAGHRSAGGPGKRQGA
ncbi:MAG: hypothetical protein RJA22_85 [Verrucomicrobiota bacterium]|jgi:predicted RNA-binding protein with PUA-like domain